MQRKIICFVALLMLWALPVQGENAMDYFNLGIKSTITRTKIKYFSKALELDPKLVEAYEKRGMLYFFQEKFDNVIQDFQSYIRLALPNAEAYRMLGMGYLKKGSYPAAIYNFTRAIETDPNMAGAYYGRAAAYYIIGNYEKTILDSTKAIELGGDPRYTAEAYRTRARAYRKTDRNELAVEDARSSWQVDPRYAIYMRSLYSYASPKDLRKSGLIALIGIVFVLIFKLRLKPPEKDE
ncbi:MAG: tetratricopeptide repeat protein [Desulfobacterales bacterium]|uniref:Tetratricopeptide repeat protein n=1 Tax=Candidatus Desulfatibia profunda TaxID=2841695 RepID=A0A8J6TKW8_9BACT|nr:tetratricopeptide repeat protein [Candidatus Desulfatibia profunda]MBL7179951.1 tetratricopeptide repeat protein [Desulfobacterales bacterium]